MDNQSTNHANMIRTTNKYCADNTSATSGMAAFAPALAQSQAKLLLIDQLDQIAITTTKGVTLDTKALRKSMTSIALKCSNAVHAYATATNNNTLKAQVNYAQSTLDRLKKEEIDDVCQTIRDVTNTNIAAVQTYGVAAADVTTLQTTINLYRTGSQNPRQALINKSDAIKQIKELIKDITQTTFKELMDKMVLTLKASNPNFVNKYFLAREIIDLGSNPPPPVTTHITLITHQTILQAIILKIAGNALATGTEQFKINFGDGTEMIGTLGNGILTSYPHDYNIPGADASGIYTITITPITAGAFSLMDVLQFDNCKLKDEVIIPADVQPTGIQMPNNKITNLSMQAASFANLTSLVPFNNDIPDSNVNAYLIGLDNNGLLNGFANFGGGTNGTPSGAGITAKNNLIAKGWTVLTN
ncbi:MAG: hypothetical protein HY840_08940 [Bacteroidetes bacterium]|nr:hypothetical protein [Bacteroidota bacterium]